MENYCRPEVCDAIIIKSICIFCFTAKIITNLHNLCFSKNYFFFLHFTWLFSAFVLFMRSQNEIDRAWCQLLSDTWCLALVCSTARLISLRVVNTFRIHMPPIHTTHIHTCTCVTQNNLIFFSSEKNHFICI